ncbi:MAG: aldehyde ferredoxin oxidoreductase N-terminal domain-containing protein, partial [Nitrospinota bacterium]
MWTEAKGKKKRIGDYRLRRVRAHLDSGKFETEELPCTDVEDFLGGIARSFKQLGGYRVREAYDPAAPLIMNLGNLSGTDAMTGLRVFFSAYSPLKVANNGMPLAMWSAASGKFGTKLAAAGVDEMIFLGRAPKPVYLVIRSEGGRPTCALEDATHLLGKTTHEKIVWLAERYPDAHFCAVGPSGENWQTVRYAGIACSTVNQLRSKHNKPRFAGRGGMGGIMGSKNLLALVAQAPDRKGGQLTPKLVEVNKEIARGEGSRNYRD